MRQFKLPGALRPSIVTAAVILWVTAFMVLPATGFLGRGSVLEGYGDIFGVHCGGSQDGRVVHHREITREGVRRAMVEYYEEVPPSGRQYNHRDGMTLEESYSEYFGPEAAPKKFLEALEKLVDAGVDIEAGNLGSEPRYHFNNELFQEAQKILSSRWRRIVRAANSADYAAARYMLGVSLATVQDFYAHSNWIELGNEDIKRDLGIPGHPIMDVALPGDVTCSNCNDQTDCLTTTVMSQKKLTSDYLPGTDGSTADTTGKCQHTPRHSRGAPARGGISKDLPSACYSPRHDLHERAAQLAAQATAHYLTTLRKTIGDRTFLKVLSVSPSPALVLVLDTSAPVETTMEQTIQRLQQEHEALEYPPEEYIMVLYGAKAPSVSLLRSDTPAPLGKYLATLEGVNPLRATQDDSVALSVAAHAAPHRATLYLLTDASVAQPRAATLVAIMGLVQEKLLQVTPIMITRSNFFRIPRLGFMEDNEVENHGAAVEEEEKTTVEYFSRETVDQVDVEVLAPSAVQMERQMEHLQLVSTGGGVSIRPTLEYLSVMSGSHAVGVNYNSLEEMSKMITARQHTQAILYRALSFTGHHDAEVAVDGTISKIRVQLYGNYNGAMLTSPTGVMTAVYGSDRSQVIVRTDMFTIAEVTVTSGDAGLWRLSLDSDGVAPASVIVTGVTTLDMTPAFYRSDAASLHPSLLRLTGSASSDWGQYLDVIMTGIDTASLKTVSSVTLKAVNDRTQGSQLPLATLTPRRNSYISLKDAVLPQDPFTVVYRAVDREGNSVVRESSSIFYRPSARVEFGNAKEVWGTTGSTLSLPITVTNSLPRTATFLLTATDAYQYPMAWSKNRVTLASNETSVVMLHVRLVGNAGRDSSLLRRRRNSLYTTDTNTLTVTAVSDAGEYSTASAHIVLQSQQNLNDEVRGHRNHHLNRLIRTNNHPHHHEPLTANARRRRDHKSRDLGALFSGGVAARPQYEDNYNQNKFSHPFRNGPLPGHYGPRPGQNDPLPGYNGPPPGPQSRPPFGGQFYHSLGINVYPSPANGDASNPFPETSLEALSPPIHDVTNHFYPNNPIIQRPTNQIPPSNINVQGHLGGSLLPAQPYQGAGQRAGMKDTAPPIIEIQSISSCPSNNSPTNCNDQRWTANIRVYDEGIGLQRVSTSPYSQIPTIQEFQKEVVIQYSSTCCYPKVTVFAADMFVNTAERIIENGNAPDALTAGGIAGIVIGCIFLLIIIVIIIVLIVRRQKKKKQMVQLRGRRSKSFEEQ